jgi:hypothetical protein
MEGRVGTWRTVREIVVVLDKPPEVPLTVTVTVPVLAVVLAVSVKTLVLAVLVGLKDAVTPPGNPEADRATVPVNPPCGLIVIVLVPLAPCKIVRLLGEAESA